MSDNDLTKFIQACFSADAGGNGSGLTKPPATTGAQPPSGPRTAGEILSKAASLVDGDRDRQHGAKADNFQRIANMWNAYNSIRRDSRLPYDAVDVGHMMALFKVARTQSGSLNPDDYIDCAGYIACAGEIALSQVNPIT